MRQVQKCARFNKLDYMKNQRKGSRFPGEATLYGRLGEALKSDAYVDFRAGQLTRVNLVEVSG